MRNLLQLAVGKRARLACVKGEAGFRRRLLEMGFLPGTDVELVRRVDVGQLLELDVRGSRISLRLQEAEHVFVAE
jgi:Fe2+ transport system protein FeoA